MNGIIVYYEVDVTHNTRFISLMNGHLRKCGISLSTVTINGGQDAEPVIRQLERISLPDFVVNRSRNAEVASYFEARQVRVFNTGILTHTANDKFLTYRHLYTHGVPVMDTVCVKKDTQVPYQYPYVIKTVSGHGGTQVCLVQDADCYADVYRRLAAEEHPIIAQPLCDEPGIDVRVYVIGGKPVLAMQRENPYSFKSNYSLGGSAKQIPVGDELQSLTEQIVQSFDCPLDYVGIDFIRHQGKYVCNEIEDAAGARMVYENTDIDIVTMFAEYIVNVLRREKIQ